MCSTTDGAKSASPLFFAKYRKHRGSGNGRPATNFLFLCTVKVLILHQHFKTPGGGGAIRSYYLAKALVEKGAEVVVVTGHNEGGYRKEILEGIEVHHLPVPYDNRFSFTKRILAFSGFVIRALMFSRRHRDAGLCYAISTPLSTGLAALIIRWWYKIPYIFEVGDLWPDAPIEMGFVRNPLLRRRLYDMERRIYRSAHSIVALSDPIRDSIKKKIAGKAIHVLPNMADTQFFKPEEKRPLLEDKYGVKGKFVVSYIGALGVANGLDYLLACAAATARKNSRVHFLICGDGAMLPVLKKSAIRLSLANLSFIPFQNRAGVQEIMNITDANFISYQPVKILETGSPNKYFDGLAAGKLTIVNFGGWIREEIEREACGVYSGPGQAESFPATIQPFLADPSLLKKYQRRGRELAERKYSRTMLGQTFLAVAQGACLHAKAGAEEAT